jgi:glycosyltransferase involved in cell wall biosynthesis
MNQPYPDGHHPCYFLVNALSGIGIRADFARDARTLNCWGMVFPDFNNRVLVWLIDNRLPNERVQEDAAAKELLSRGAVVCHAQKPDMERVGGYWLSLAASPGFEPVAVAKTADVCFVGYVRDESRARLLSDVGAKFKVSVKQGVFGRRANEAYCGARVGLNIPSYYGQPYCYDINMRVFEIAACGVPLVTNYLPELAELGFIDGYNYFAYKSPADLPEAIARAIHYRRDHPGMLVEPEFMLMQDIQAKHTYQARAVQVHQWLTN